MRVRRREAGVALAVVLIFAMLLAAGIATFLRRAVVDSLIIRHRDAAAEAEALARGGVDVALALLYEDLLAEGRSDFRVETLSDPWARIADVPLEEGDALLRLRILDAGSRLNLNALLDEEGRADEHAQFLLEALFEKVLAEMERDERDAEYGPDDLARNLLDYIDADDTGPDGRLEDDYYQRQDPPYRAANRPLLSVDELGLVQGFDGELVEALRPYVTVHPYAGGGGINPNTAPPHVLALLYSQDALDARSSRLASAEQVRQILERRERGDIFCDESFEDENRSLRCVGLSEVIPGQIYPPPSFRSDVFLVTAEARVGEVTRPVEAALRRSRQDTPPLLSWRLR